MKVAPRFELGIEALQASALPLGHATIKDSVLYPNLQNQVKQKKCFSAAPANKLFETSAKME